MNSRPDERHFKTFGLPHSATHGSKDVCSSPWLFAAYHGLRRLIAPRHPPQTCIRLTILLHNLRTTLVVNGVVHARLELLGFIRLLRVVRHQAMHNSHVSSTLVPFSVRSTTEHGPKAVKDRPPKLIARTADSHPSEIGHHALNGAVYLHYRKLEVWGFEPQTYGLQSHRSSHLSYTPPLAPEPDGPSQSVYKGSSSSTYPRDAQGATLDCNEAREERA